MAFKDNIGVTEELKVEMMDCTVSVSRTWLEDLHAKLIGLRLPLEPRPQLEEIIKNVEQALN